MTTTISTASAWYYDKASEVLFVNEDTKRVGINNDAPQYELQVNGQVFATEYLNLPEFAMSNDIFPVANYTSNQIPLINSNLAFCRNVAVYSSNNMVFNSNVVSLSNLNVLDTIKRNGSNIVDTDGKVDYRTWIKNGPVFNQDNTLATTGVVLGTLGVLTGAGAAVLTNQGKMGEALFDDVMQRGGGFEDTDDYDPTQAEEANTYTHWQNIIYKPIYHNIGKQEVGFGSNIYIAKSNSILIIDKTELVDYDGGRTRRIANNPSTSTLYDGKTGTLVAKYGLFSSNVNVGNIVNTLNVITSNLTTSNIIATTQISCGVFTITPDGIYINYSNPFTSQKVIDNNGRYLGSITKEQITNLEGFNLSSMADGVMEWGNFQSATNPIYENPFTNVDNPLFVVD